MVELVLAVLGGVFVLGEMLDWLRRHCQKRATDSQRNDHARLMQEVKRHASDGR